MIGEATYGLLHDDTSMMDASDKDALSDSVCFVR